MPELVCAADDPRWQAERQRGITATDIPVILGLTTWDSPYSLWCRKTGVPLPSGIDPDRARLGHHMEPYVAQRWSEDTGEPLMPAGLYASSDAPWQMATPDQLTGNGEPWEGKSWADADKAAWDGGPPAKIRVQAIWQASVMDVTQAHVSVIFLPSGRYGAWTITRDPAELGDIILEAVRFYRQVLGELPPPTVEGSAATLAALRARWIPQEGPAADIPADLWDCFTEGKSAMSEGKRVKQEAEAKIREIAQGATRYKVAGRIVARRTISHISGGTRKAYTRDTIRITGTTGDTSDDD